MKNKTDKNANKCSTEENPAASSQSNTKSWQLLALLYVPIAVNGFYIFSPVFTMDVPDYKCLDNETENTLETGNAPHDLLSNETTLYDAECYRAVRGEPGNSSTEDFIKCNTGWRYNLSEEQTIVNEFNLICDNAWKRPLFTSVMLVAMIFGSFFGGVLSDRIGRQPVIRISSILLAISLLSLSFASLYEVLLVIQFVIGFSFVIIFYTGYILVQETVPETKRSFSALLMSVYHTMGYLMLPLVAYFVRDWRWLVRIVGITNAVYAPLFIWLIPESSKWNKQHSVENRKKSNAEMLMGDKDCEEQNESKPIVASILCSNPVLRKRIFISCFLWNVCLMTHYTMSLNTSNLGGNKYINAVISAVVDMACYIVMSIMLRKFGRRTLSTVCLSLSGFFSLLTPTLREVHVTAGIVSSMTGKFFIATAVLVVTLFVGEMFPTLLRNTSIGISSMSSRLASALAPFLIFAGKMVNLSIPFYVLGVLAMFGAAFVLLLPETSDTELPNTVQEAVDLDKGRTCFKLHGITECSESSDCSK